ncbi:MAG: hypothetical protein IJD88_06600, partial [Clostridia bacterium]|nr:hypothetical protein [Clostridia bacterium]
AVNWVKCRRVRWTMKAMLEHEETRVGDRSKGSNATMFLTVCVVGLSFSEFLYFVELLFNLCCTADVIC